MDIVAIFIMMVFVVVAFLVGFFLSKKSKGSSEQDMVQRTQEMEAMAMRITQSALREAQEQLLLMADEKLKNQSKISHQELEHKKDLIAEMMGEVRKELVKANEHVQATGERQIASFAAMTKELETYKQITKDLQGSTDDLKKVLSNNQLRGQFGEQVAENLLRMAGFVIGQDYVFNKEQENTDTRPDFTIFLPDRTRINIDAKFPFTALVKASETDDKAEKDHHLKQFAQDVKQKIKQVTSRDYINPEEKTVDFVILFIPNEMIFSFIYDQLNDIWEEAMTKKVIFAGPFSFTALLRMIKQAYTNFSYQENVHQVIGLIQKFESEYQKYSESVDGLGKSLSTTVKQYEALSGTRTRVLSKIIDQIKNQQITGQDGQKMLEM